MREQIKSDRVFVGDAGHPRSNASKLEHLVGRTGGARPHGQQFDHLDTLTRFQVSVLHHRALA